MNIVYNRDDASFPLVESAKVWYYQHLDPEAPAIKRYGKLPGHWKDAYTVKATNGGTLLVVPAPGYTMANKDYTFKRFLIFAVSGDDIADGRIIEFMGKKYNVDEHVDLLLKNHNQNTIAGFNGEVLQYDFNYGPIVNAVYENGEKNSLKQASFVTSTAGAKLTPDDNKLRSLATSCTSVTPSISGTPSGIANNCQVVYFATYTYNSKGCLLTLHYSYVSHSCPVPAGGGSGSGSGSGGGSTTPPGGGGGGGSPGGNSNLANALLNALQVDPSMLVKCETVALFQALASFKAPQAVIDRINYLNSTNQTFSIYSNPYFIQQIKNAYGTQINLDRFEINVNTLPKINGTRLTAPQFLNHIRTNINSYIDNSIGIFQPYIDASNNINDQTRWNSTAPLGAMANVLLGDDGSVIVTESTTNSWTVATIRTPIDGGHPVSGSRKWGYDSKPGGGYVFYVTGVDRITTPFVQAFQDLAEAFLPGMSPFARADALWASYQNKVAAFVNSNSGTASVAPNPTKERPNFELIQNYLNGQITLQQLKDAKGCN